MTIKENLKRAIENLTQAKIEEPMLKARLLLCYVLEMTKEDLIIHSYEELKKDMEIKYQKRIRQLIEGIPLQYITHHQEFMKLDFYVDERVLIPRADTETIVEEVICYASLLKKQKVRILDLCTGSGIIAISIKKYLPKCEILATDISNAAMEVAKKNAKCHNVAIDFIQSDLFEKIEGEFDIIVSNPPYIKKEVIPTLDKQVQREPKIALDGGKDGLLFYKKIIQESPEYLTNEGGLFLEIGYDQKKEVLEIIANTKQYDGMNCKKDLAGNDRMIVARKKR
ncbi:MAG: peptide chain release factor N(5)-glutamine methyltransferase [Clostridia bacterium]|nr:peptide chain release factor N(5)-glutamine methyltransferase [Clostridia bacterium]